ncbi:MAG: hypothetical protein RhofKO_10660 [Rhodothermales bacterium]
MSDLLERYIAQVPSARNHRPNAHLTIGEALEAIRNGTHRRHAERVRAIADKEQRRKAKASCPAYAFCGRFSYVKRDGIETPSGVVCLDYDGLDDREAAKAKLRQSPHVLAFFESISGEHSSGLKVLVPVSPPPSTNEENHRAYDAAAQALGIGKVDSAARDISRLCFVSHDPNLFINPNAVPVRVDNVPLLQKQPRQQRPSVKTRKPNSAIIPDGEKYATLRTVVGLLRRCDIDLEIVRTMIHAAHEEHGQTVGEREPLDRLVDDAYIWEPNPNSSIRRLVEAAVTHERAEKATEQQAMPWVPLPIDVFPNVVRRYLGEAAKAIGVDVAALAVPGLVVLGAAIGNSYRVRIKRGWLAGTTLWGATVLPSGGAKSPALDAILRPVIHLEHAAARQYAEELEAWQALPAEDRAQEPKPVRKRYRLSDSTLETSQFIHADNARGLMLGRDELSGWFGGFDKYTGGESDMTSWIELHGGRSAPVDRKSNKERPTLDLPYPAVNVVGTIQPRTLKERISPAHVHTGFIHRLLMAMPPWKALRWTDDEASEAASRQYDALIQRLYALPFDVDEGPKVISMVPAAREHFKAFKNACADEIERMPDVPLRSFFAKLDGMAAQFALIFHIADVVGERPNAKHSEAIGLVSEGAINRGIRLARWFAYEIPRIHHTLKLSRRVMDKDVAQCLDLPETFTRGDVMKVWGVKERQANNVIKKLEEHGHIQPVEGKGHYKRRIAHYPIAFSAFSPVSNMVFAGKEQKGQQGNGQSAPRQSPANVYPIGGDTAPPQVFSQGDRVMTPGGIATVKRMAGQYVNVQHDRRETGEFYPLADVRFAEVADAPF